MLNPAQFFFFFPIEGGAKIPYGTNNHGSAGEAKSGKYGTERLSNSI